MGKACKDIKMIEVTDSNRIGATYFIAPAHAKVIGIFKDIMETVTNEQKEMEPVSRRKLVQVIIKIALDETPEMLADLMAWLFRSPDFKITDGLLRHVSLISR